MFFIYSPKGDKSYIKTKELKLGPGENHRPVASH
jgi:hypothetical protein